jgi:uncharacterized protein (TIGR02001 family)
MNKLLPTMFIAASTLVAAVSVAQAQDFSANIGTTNNYVWRGVTQTKDGFAVQGGADVDFGNGFSAGTWASNVDWGAGDLEFDVYGNYSFPLTDLISANVGGIYYLYPGKASDVDANFYEINFGLEAAVGTGTISTSVAHSPAVAGEATWYFNAGFGVPIIDSYEFFAGVGYYEWEVTDGWMDYNVGVSGSFANNFTLSAYYAGTSLTDDNGSLVLMLTASLP